MQECLWVEKDPVLVERGLIIIERMFRLTTRVFYTRFRKIFTYLIKLGGNSFRKVLSPDYELSIRFIMETREGEFTKESTRIEIKFCKIEIFRYEFHGV